MNHSQINKQSGFTLIELLVVIGIIAILATIVIIAINPPRQFAQARNTQRSSNVNAILNAIGQFIADKKGDLPSGTPAKGATAIDIPKSMCSDLVPTYIPSLPTDPKSADYSGAAVTTCSDLDAKDTGYTVAQDNNGRITVAAPLTEVPPADAVISITR